MSGWHIAHLVCIGAWAGLVLAEMVIELGGLRTEGLRYAVARFHRSIDLFVEIPVFTGVLITGLVLIIQVQTSAMLWVKVALGLGAVLINVACVFPVMQRARAAEEGLENERYEALTRRVFLAAFTGVPLAMGALYLGGQRMAWW